MQRSDQVFDASGLNSTTYFVASLLRFFHILHLIPGNPKFIIWRPVERAENNILLLYRFSRLICGLKALNAFRSEMLKDLRWQLKPQMKLRNCIQMPKILGKSLQRRSSSPTNSKICVVQYPLNNKIYKILCETYRGYALFSKPTG